MNRFQTARRPILGVLGFLSGLINGFFGSGGGMVTVQAMEKNGLDSKRAHASSILAILPLSVISAIIYGVKGNLSFGAESLCLLGGASVGGILGALLLEKISARWLDLIFTALMLLSGIRMLLS